VDDKEKHSYVQVIVMITPAQHIDRVDSASSAWLGRAARDGEPWGALALEPDKLLLRHRPSSRFRLPESVPRIYVVYKIPMGNISSEYFK
jgi:hypothetical protein